ncbi:MAG: glycoside hydrolase family 3 C-terminal domain-containing protein [Agathobacter sp.]|nr:glycoside hydrolase family 3 C-terminal domain-containing protein [Agathobacter sp.]
MGLKYEKIINKMSLEDKALMMSGKNTWQTQDFPQYGIPSMMMSDGPHGMRTQPSGVGDHLGLNASMPATCFPTAATIANSWDESLGEEIGKALAEEAVSMGVHVILGPGLNIKRSPLCGRNFEYFSEDPYHAGKMAASYVKGIQSYGISACPKHFAVNSQELRRMAMNSVVDERTLREIYLTGFEIAVKEGKAKSIMSSYNEVNGVYANENKHLLQEILVDEWGFDGYVVSDWGASNDHALGVKHGSHLEMPGTTKTGQKEILKGIAEGVLTEEELDQRLDELLDVIFTTHEGANKAREQYGIKDSSMEYQAYDVEAHHALARKAAEEGIVLLKNEGNILPLAEKTKVAIIGDFAQTPRYQGAGSSLVNPSKEPESILTCIEDSGLHMVSFAQGYKRNAKPDAQLVETAIKAAKEAETVLVFAGLDEIGEAEGLDRTNMKMAEAQNVLIDALAEKYENVIVVLSAGSPIEMPWADKVKAIVQGYLGGQAGASAMLNVLTGKVNPSGRLNETYPLHYEDTPAYAYYPSKERSSEYRESLYVGYRYYTTVGKEVAYPFGYGLSYTTFAYSNITANEQEVRFTIKNTGDRDGVEVPQLYVGMTSDTVFRPVRELKGFARVKLAAGEEKEVVIPFDDKTFRFFDVRTNTWEVESGTYRLMVARNANEIELETDVNIAGTVKEGPYSEASLSTYFAGNIANVSDDEFKSLYGKEIPDGSWSGEIGINDAFCQFYYAKSGLCRLVYKVLKGQLDKAMAKGEPNLDILFIYNMPIRGISRMTGGMVNMKMVYGITEIANGHFFKGLGKVISGFIKGA